MAVAIQLSSLSCYTTTMKTKTSGIYKLSINSKFYIGGSTVLETRFTKHRSKLKTNTHSNANMLAAYKECQDVKFEILELCTKEDLKIREQVYIDQFFGTPDCMNIDPLSTGSPKRPVGYKLSAAQKEHMSIKMMGNTNGRFGKGVKRTMSAESQARQIAASNAKHNKPVLVIKPNGETMTFESRTTASKYFDLPVRTLTNWILEPNRSRKQFQDWTFKCPGKLH